MASHDTFRNVVDGRSIASRLSTAVTGLVGAFAAWNDARMTRKALSRLSDHELDDLGLTRGDIAKIGSRLTQF